MATVLAYDESGNRRVPTPVALGDEIDWKRQGTAGSYRAKVLDIRTDNKGRTRLVVHLLSHDGRSISGGRSRSITSGIMHVYPTELPVPYPDFCRHPEKCRGKAACPREFACND